MAAPWAKSVVYDCLALCSKLKNSVAIIYSNFQSKKTLHKIASEVSLSAISLKFISDVVHIPENIVMPVVRK